MDSVLLVLLQNGFILLQRNVFHWSMNLGLTLVSLPNASFHILNVDDFLREGIKNMMRLCSHGNHISSSVPRSSLSWRICRFNESFAVFLNKSLHSFFFLFLFRVLIMMMEKTPLSLQCLVLALEEGFLFF